jgi:hypothetical protein
MDFLRAIFEDQLEIRRDKKGNAIIGDTVFTPVAILKADSAAYEYEYSNWHDEIWQPEQNELLEQILNIRGNKKRFDDLCVALKNGHVIPLVGSGMSVPSGLQTWSEFLRSIRWHSKMNVEDLEKLLANSEFEEAVEQVEQTMSPRLFDEQIEHSLRIDDPQEYLWCS